MTEGKVWSAETWAAQGAQQLPPKRRQRVHFSLTVPLTPLMEIKGLLYTEQLHHRIHSETKQEFCNKAPQELQKALVT